MDNVAGQILILSGSPGCGKTTTAERLARLPGTPKVHLHTDDFWGNIKHGHIDPWLPEADAQNHMVMEIAAGVAGRYAQAGYFVALDGVIRPWSMPIFAAIALPLHYIVLRTNVAEAVARCQARGGDSLTDPDVVADLHSQFSDLGIYQDHILPTDGLDPSGTLQAVITAFKSGDHRVK